MRHQKLIIKSLNPISDGLGGYMEEYVDIQVYGKVAYKKDKMVVTRAHDVNTQKLVNMVMMYLNVNRNPEPVLQSLKKGDRFIYNNVAYSIHLIEAYQKVYVITFMEDFNIVESDIPEEPVIPDEPDDVIDPEFGVIPPEDSIDGEIEDYWN